MCLSKTCCNRNDFFSLFHDVFNFNITITRDAVGVDIKFKNLNFKNLTKNVLVSTMFIHRADNLAQLIGMRIILISYFCQLGA